MSYSTFCDSESDVEGRFWSLQCPSVHNQTDEIARRDNLSSSFERRGASIVKQ